jgi:formylglycine-generating enzyme
MRARRSASAILVATIVAGAIVGVACGLDQVGTKEAPVPGQDTSIPVDASPVPRADASDLDAAVEAEASRPPSCPAAHGSMVFVDAGATLSCIDATEVTNAEYDLFLAATGGGVPSQLDAGAAPGCAGNLSFARFTVGIDPPAFPASRIDWCDAYSFCSWAGKRLCGKTSQGDAATGEWFRACSNGGQRLYPYGNTFVAGACNEDATGLTTTQAVGSSPGCEGGVPGLYDMNGNVSELIDNCGPTTCTAVGGYYYEPTPGCAVVREVLKSTVGAELGFRCCADAE